MKRVTAREANQAFSKLLKAAAQGEEIVITRRGEPVAKLVSAAGEGDAKRRELAVEQLIGLLRKGFRLGGLRVSREESHER